ncbi:unnamed protein product, partial [Ectocarpus sp. 8 AP-2014]
AALADVFSRVSKLCACCRVCFRGGLRAAELSCVVFVLVVVLSLFCGVNGQSWCDSDRGFAFVVCGFLLKRRFCRRASSPCFSREPGQSCGVGCTYLEFERVPEARKVP